MALRMGLVGSGPWVRIASGPGMQAAKDVEAVGLWARDDERRNAAAHEVGLTAYDDYDALLDDVDAVAFSVAPTAQADLAMRAARAGKHLLLDKPVSLDPHAAEELLDVVRSNELAALVFFTDRFMPGAAQWFDEVAATPGWSGGLGYWFGALESTVFGASAWRRQHGAFWDIGPHVLSNFTALLGPIHELTALAGAGDVVHLVARHESGVTSCATLTQYSAPGTEGAEFFVWGSAGRSDKPPRDDHPDAAFAAACTELAALVAGDPKARRNHPCGLEFGVHQVRLLSDAQAGMQQGEELSGPVGIA